MKNIDRAYPALFSPMALAGKRLKNRIIHASISPHVDSRHGVQDSLITYYRNRARGGAAAVVTEPIGIGPHQRSSRMRAFDASMESGLRRLAEAVESEDCRLLGQIQDSGRGRHVPGRNYGAVGASALPDDLSWTMPEPLSQARILEFIELATVSAFRLQHCGFSGVELSAGHGHLFHQFLSPRSNIRLDEYGGSLEGRARFLRELIASIRAACGSGFIIGAKLPADDGVPDSIPPDEGSRIARHVADTCSVDYLCYAQGSHHNSLEMHIPDDSYPRIPYLGLIKRMREATGRIATAALGRITDPAEAEGILQRGDAELIALGRPLIADPEWPNKARLGNAKDIRYCVSCNTCWKVIINHSPLVCDNNPLVMRADEVGYVPPKARVPRKVVVVGAGVAGLQAAWVAAARGHRVTVIGASPQLGGKAWLQAQLPISESISSVFDYQEAKAKEFGVELILNRRATLSSIANLRPDVVVLATGSTMVWPSEFPADLQHSGFIKDLREAVMEVQRYTQQQQGTAVLFDMDHTDGTYAGAERLRDIFSEVVVVTPRQAIAEEVALTSRQRILRRFQDRRIRYECLSVPEWTPEFEESGRLQINHVYGGDPKYIDDVALLTYSTPRTPDSELEAPLKEMGITVHRIGDCKVARDVLAATREGHAIGELI